MAGLSSGPHEAAQALLRPDIWIDCASAAQAPAWHGAYFLLIRLDRHVRFERGDKRHRFEAGWYAYVGSAYGPGGVGARLRRHFRRDKKLHWHADHLTLAAGEVIAAAIDGGSECEIVRSLVASPAFGPSLQGFGSSDCRMCGTHLLEWKP